MQQFQLAMTPSENDFYEKNGKKIPNSSKNRKRKPITPEKLKFSMEKGQPSWEALILEKKIDSTSRYFRPTLPKEVFHYEVVNEGRSNVLLCVGDTHAQVGIRFMKLYEDAVQNNKTADFPTVVLIVIPSSVLIPGEKGYDFVTGWIEEFKPNRVLFIYQWTGDWFASFGSLPLKYHSIYFY